MSGKHSPLPWRVAVDDYDNANPDCPAILDADGELVTELPTNGVCSEELCLADVRLIVCAVNSIAATQALLARLSEEPELSTPVRDAMVLVYRAVEVDGK